MLSTTHETLPKFQEQYISKYIALADTKAMWTFAAASGTLLYLSNKINISNIDFKDFGSLIALTIMALIILSLIYACYTAFRTIRPNTATNNTDNLIFFGAVAKFPTAEKYIEAVRATSEEQLFEKRLTHCHDLAKVCTAKYQYLKRSQFAAFFGIMAVVILVIFVTE